MSNKDIDNYYLFKRFFGGLGSSSISRGMNNRRRLDGLFDTQDIFREFGDMQEEMSRMFNKFNDISSNAPKEMVRVTNIQRG